MNAKSVIKVRELRESDLAFIFATWLRQLWFSPSNKTTFGKEEFMRLHHMRIEKVLKEKPVRVACLLEDEDVIVGYEVKDSEPFTYMKKAWRGLGVEKLLKEAS